MVSYGLITAVLLVLMQLVLSYHFQDPYFNNGLLLEMEELSGLPEVYSRYKRSLTNQRSPSKAHTQVLHCYSHTQSACCGRGNVFNMDDSVKDINHKCFLKISKSSNLQLDDEPIDYFNCTQMTEFKRRAFCIKQCVGMQLDILDQDGNIRESRMRQYMLQTVSSDNWKKQLATDAIDTCIASGNRSVSRKDENGVEQCNPAAMDFLYCTWAETQLNCPSKYRLAGEQCDKVRKKLQKFTRSKRNLLNLPK